MPDSDRAALAPGPHAGATWAPEALPYVLVPATDASAHFEVDVEAQDGEGARIALVRLASVWLQNDQSWPRVWAARRVTDAAWGTARPISDGQSQVSEPRIAMDERGTAVLVWLHADGSATRVVGSVFDHAEGSWSAPETLSLATDSVAQYPVVAIEPRGNAIVMWIQPKDDKTQTLRWARYLTGSGWKREESSVADFDSTSQLGVSSPTVGMDGQGRAITAWVDKDSIWSAHYE